MTVPSVDAAQFRQLLGRFATGVAVLTARAPDGHPVGITVNTLTSVSLDPPIVLVCIEKDQEIHDNVAASRYLVFNVLASDQETLSRRFASSADASFKGIGYRLDEHGIPLLDGVLAHVDCERMTQTEGGDHTVFFARVIGGEVTDRRPLLYYRGGYASLPGG